jgi:hypothetical protein
MRDIGAVVVDEAVLSSDISPFKEGNQDFIYSLYFEVGKTRKKLLSLSYRIDSSDKAQIVFDYFSSILGLLVNPLSYKQIGISVTTIKSIRRPYQVLSVRAEHCKTIKCLVMCHFFQARTIDINHVKVERKTSFGLVI